MGTREPKIAFKIVELGTTFFVEIRNFKQQNVSIQIVIRM
jgi:hypothetical protein